MLKNILFGFILVLLCAPLLNKFVPIIPDKPLRGAVNIPDSPELSARHWFSGSFQEKYVNRYEFEVGLRSFLIRLRNHCFYALFGETSTNVRKGEASQFYSWDYWSAFKGYDIMDRDSLVARVESLAALRDSLSKRGKVLLCVIAPNKVRYMPEYLPEALDKEPGNPTLYDWYRSELELRGIPLLDLNKYFIEAKDTVLKPLFANTSIHWSGYGMNLGIKKLIETLEVLGQRRHINLRYASWVMKDSVIHSDRDMVDLLNILVEPPTEPLAYPVYHMEERTEERRVKVLLIGDSFFWNFYSFDVRFEVFHPSTRFWYYNNTQYDLYETSTPVSELSAWESCKHVDYVVIMATEANLHLFPYGFPEKYLQE